MGIIGELVDSAKEVLAYFAGEETYEVRKFDIRDIPEVCGRIFDTQRKRTIITLLPSFYKLDLKGFRRYYKPATETLLVACRSKFVKPHYIVDLLENGQIRTQWKRVLIIRPYTTYADVATIREFDSL